MIQHLIKLKTASSNLAAAAMRPYVHEKNTQLANLKVPSGNRHAQSSIDHDADFIGFDYYHAEAEEPDLVQQLTSKFGFIDGDSYPDTTVEQWEQSEPPEEHLEPPTFQQIQAVASTYHDHQAYENQQPVQQVQSRSCTNKIEAKQSAKAEPQLPRKRSHDDEDPLLDLDYSHEALRNMSYAKLANESFDTDPCIVNAKVTADDDLPALLEGLLQHGEAPAQAVEAMMNGMQHLTTSQWEAAGDWIMTELSQVTKELTQLRKSKRKTTSAFEKKIEARNDQIQGMQATLDNTISEMREQGRAMLTPKRK